MSAPRNSCQPLRVVKIGGSLLELPDLIERLERWLGTQPKAVSLFIVGGGQLVNAVRDWAALHTCDQVKLHWICIGLLEVSFQLLAEQVSDWVRLTSPDELSAFAQAARQGHRPASIARSSGRMDRALVRVAAFYDRESLEKAGESSPARQLPESWDTTSDSLAALLATQVQADELVLLKSCAIVTPTGSDSAVDSEIVDRAFAKASSELQVRLVNLREWD